jgi:hypothetical protein
LFADVTEHTRLVPKTNNSDLTCGGGPISEQWLQLAGFKWHHIERQPNRQWVLWLGSAIEDGVTARLPEVLDVGMTALTLMVSVDTWRPCPTGQLREERRAWRAFGIVSFRFSHHLLPHFIT